MKTMLYVFFAIDVALGLLLLFLRMSGDDVSDLIHFNDWRLLIEVCALAVIAEIRSLRVQP